MEFFELKKMISDFLIPLPFFLTIGFLGFLRLTFVGRSFVPLAALFISFVGLFLTSFAPLAVNSMSSLERPYFKKTYPEKKTFRYIHVLGGGYAGYAELEEFSAVENLSNASLKRLLEGVRLYRKYPKTKLVISGARSKERQKTMAEAYFEAARFLGVPEKDLFMLKEPKDTGAEAEALKALMESQKLSMAAYAAKIRGTKREMREMRAMMRSKSFLLVTSAAHMKRALAEFKSLGLEPIPFAADYIIPEKPKKTWGHYVPRASNMEILEKFWHETLGMIWQQLRGVS